MKLKFSFAMNENLKKNLKVLLLCVLNKIGIVLNVKKS